MIPHPGNSILWGLIATGALTVVLSLSQGFGWSRISLPFILGTVFSGRRQVAMVLGLGLHILVGVVFGVLYAMAFESLQYASWWSGAIFGTYHGVFMLTVFLEVLPNVHPRMAGKHHGPTPTRQLEPPGFLGLNYGRSTPLITLVAHIAYGVVLGAFYPL